MTAAEPPEFPLTSLPYLAQKHAVGTMPLIDIISYSLTSAYSKFIVKSLHLSAKQLVIRIHDTDVQFTVIDRLDPLVSRVTLTCKIKRKARKLWKIPTRSDVEFVNCGKPEFSPRDWLCYLMDIFNCKNLEVRFESEINKKTKKLAKKIFDGLDIENVYITDDSGKLYHDVVQSLQSVNNLTLRVESFLGTVTLYESLRLRIRLPVPFPPLSFKMKHSPNCNFMTLEVYEETNAPIINEFLKRWIQSPNPKLISMTAHLMFYPTFIIDILEGIDYKHTWFNWTSSDRDGESVQVMYSIRSEDGTIATIQLSSHCARWEDWDRKCFVNFEVLRE